MAICRWRYTDTLTGTQLVSEYMTELEARKRFGPLLLEPIRPCLACQGKLG